MIVRVLTNVKHTHARTNEKNNKHTRGRTHTHNKHFVKRKKNNKNKIKNFDFFFSGGKLNNPEVLQRRRG